MKQLTVWHWGLALSGLALLTVVGSACGGSELRTVFNQQRPLILTPCATATNQPGEEPARRSAAALLRALGEHRWQVLEAAPDASVIVAKACRMGSGDEVCVAMRYEIDATGRVVAYTTPGTVIDSDTGNTLVGWMRNIEVKFTNYRCLVGVAIAQELSLAGIR